MLKILSRIVEPTEGSARLRGRVASLLEVGTGFHPELSGRENIYLNGSILGMKKREIDAKFDEIVAFAEIEKFLDTPVKRYSSGMYVRLAFAVAAHLDPEILIVDEVLAVGDAEFQKRCLGKMKQISERGGRTVLFVSHNMAAVRALCSKGILLKNGRIQLQDTADAAVDAYMLPERVDHAGAVRFKPPPGARIWMADAAVLADGEPAATVPMGSKISLLIRFATETPTRHPRIGWVLQSASGERLLNSNNRFQDSPAFDEPAARGRDRVRSGRRAPHAGSLRRLALARRHRHRSSRRAGDFVLRGDGARSMGPRAASAAGELPLVADELPVERSRFARVRTRNFEAARDGQST